MNKQKLMKWRGRWGIESKEMLHICNCGLCFTSLEDWKLHKKDTRAWRKYHTRVNVFGIFRVVRRMK